MIVWITLTTNAASAQTYTIGGLRKLMPNTESDKKLVIEYQASMIFHKLLNNYREENGLNTLSYNNVYWLASRNHNLWMSENGISHTEKPGSKYYTGSSPGDRLNYVDKDFCYWRGENCLANGSYFEDDSLEKIAFNMASTSLEQWRNSKPHNDNMLGVHNNEGTSFLITSDGYVWATSILGTCVIEDKMNRDHLEKDSKVTSLKSGLQVHPSIRNEIKMGIEQTIQSELKNKNITQKKYLQDAARMNKNNKSTCVSKDLRKRLIKSSNGLCLFGGFYKVKEFVFCNTYDYDDNTSIVLANDINTWLDSHCKPEHKSFGYSVIIKKKEKKLDIKIYLILS
jgi:uncharacterized protein YkwD